ncbi:MAG: type 4a pilus biogenesis protein PilO [SAR324 cluster bacterium]|uniref:Type 4a pilus biogenesis protein PilO n=1 Tax=SAR324 cluster bacterium TaxID=2024889 RepID=A0A7X9FTP0_9DELT|nr:type 4a pilus biogenesis protein PilO [SAR324 cluster bacterium]
MASAFIERFLERPKSHKVLFWIASLAFLIFVFWQYLYSPVSEKKAKLEGDKESLNKQISAERLVVRNLPKFREEVKALESLREMALNQLPYKRDMDGLLSSVTSLAKDSGLEVIRFAPGNEEIRDIYAERPIQLDFTGSFQQLMTFFDELSRLSRIISVTGINLKNPKGYQEEVQVGIDGSCKLLIYRQLEEDERIDTGSKEEDKFKRGKGKAPAVKRK